MTTTTEKNAQVQQWTDLAQQLRVDSIRSSTAAGSGHPTSSMSAADLMSVLMLSYLRYDFDDPQNPNNDHLIFSKGHASPLLYSMFKAAGAILATAKWPKALSGKLSIMPPTTNSTISSVFLTVTALDSAAKLNSAGTRLLTKPAPKPLVGTPSSLMAITMMKSTNPSLKHLD